MAKKINMTALQKLANSNKISNISSLKSTKIDSPLAKYDTLGRLWCKICNIQIKNESFWPPHINSNAHKKVVADLKSSLIPSSQKPKPNKLTPLSTSHLNSTHVQTIQPKSILKRKADESVIIVTKKPKEIPAIENSTTTDSKDPNVNLHHEKNMKGSIDLPTDFFDNHVGPAQKEGNNINMNEELTHNMMTLQTLENSTLANAQNFNMETSPENEQKSETIEDNKIKTPSSVLPKGFFDDPETDAKIRGEKLPQEVFEDEWKLFQKQVVKEETKKSDEIREFEDLKTNIQNEIVEIDEQIYKWSKIEELYVKKEEIIATKSTLTINTDNFNNNIDIAQISKHIETVETLDNLENMEVIEDDDDDALWRTKRI